MDEKKTAFEGTMVDLGEDLLETAKPPAAPSAHESDDLQRGEILLSERLLEDAKKAFRKVLRDNPDHLQAKHYLDEIQRQEIQDLLGSEPARKRFGSENEIDDDNPATVLERLEKELQINIEKTELKAVPGLFDEEGAYLRYKERILKMVADLAEKERLDLGIAHLEMGLFEVAQAIFETVARKDEYKVVGSYLLGLALIHGGKAIEATIKLEPLARDLTLPEPQKTDFLYLMGLAFERLHDARKAREFYRRVFLLNPKYRDVLEKLK